MNTAKLEKKHTPLLEQRSHTYKVLSVEDDLDYQEALINALVTLNYDDKDVEILTANSAREAIKVIAKNPDISVILLDVIMEADDAGLRLVDTIRDGIGNDLVRIVLLTGQSGVAPVNDIMKNYDIDDYWSKPDLTHDHLQTIILSNLRTWHHLKDMKEARHGMQMLVESSQRLATKRDILAYTQSILEEVSQLLNMKTGGIVCFSSGFDHGVEQALIVAASGDLAHYSHQYLGNVLDDKELMVCISKACQAKQHVFIEGYSILFFANKELEGKECILLVKLDRELLPNDLNLLQVMCENINVGFRNVALHGKLTELAYFDPVSGIHNKNWLSREIKNMSLVDLPYAKLLMLHVEDLSHTETVFGTKFVDQLIQSLYSHLRTYFTDNINIALIDRDTLAVVVYTNQEYDEQKLEPIIHANLSIEDVTHSVDIVMSSIDLALFDHYEAEQIISAGESALEHAKRHGLSFLVYSEALATAMSERYALLKDLRDAVVKDQIEIYLQPKVSLENGELIGFEALARWKHHSGSYIPPDQFITLAESCGLIGRLDENIMRRSCVALKALIEQGIRVPISVNVTGGDVVRPDYFERLEALFRELDVDSQLIELEITETQLIEEKAVICKQLDVLKKSGMKVNIDDFGTGYSSLAYLSSLALSTLKIDRSFVWRMADSEKDWQILKMIIDLAQVLGLSVIAEGIETDTQRQNLIDLGCQQGQGYLFARPMPLEQVISWVEGHSRSQGLAR
jgi:EAL domain-containing protein (putative c-di-GMP-specific phosphodiesterase class I)/GGDEF domain-containing protein